MDPRFIDYENAPVGHWVECPRCGKRGQKRERAFGLVEECWVVHEFNANGWGGCIVIEKRQWTTCPSCGETGQLMVFRSEHQTEVWVVHEIVDGEARGCLQSACEPLGLPDEPQDDPNEAEEGQNDGQDDT